MNKIVSYFSVIYCVISHNSLAQESKISFSTLHTKEINSISFSPDGKYLYSGSSDGTAKIWDFATGNALVTSGSSGAISSIKTSPDGKNCFLINTDGILYQWDVALKKQIWKFSDSAEIIKTVISRSNISSFDLSSDGKNILTGNQSGIIRLVDILSGKVILTYKKQEGDILSISFSPKGDFFISRSLDDMYLKLWETSTGKVVKKFQLPIHIKAIDFSPDGKYIVGGGYGGYPEGVDDYDILLWDVSQKQEIKRIKGHTKRVADIRFSPDGKYIASGSWDGTIKLWEVATGNLLSSTPIGVEIFSIDYSGDGKFLAVSGYGVKIIDLLNNMNTRSFNCTVQTTTMFKISPDMKYAVSVVGSSVRISDLSTGKTKSINARENYYQAFSLFFSPDSKKLLVGFTDHSVRLIELSSGALFSSWNVPYPYALSLSPDGKTAITVDEKHLVSLWDIESGALLKTLNKENVTTSLSSYAYRDDFIGAGISPDGNFAATSTYESGILIWDIKNNTILEKFPHQTPREICFSPDSKSIWAINEYDRITLWDILTHETKKTIYGEIVRYSQNGKYLITLSDNRFLTLMNAESFEELKTIDYHPYKIYSADFYPDNNTFFICGSDNKVRHIDITTKEELFSYVNTADDGWLIVLSDGRFDGTATAMKSLYYVNGLEIHPLENLFEKFYTPKLYQQIISRQIIDTKQLDLFSLKPKVYLKIISPANNAKIDNELLSIIIQATDQGGGIDEVRLYHNGKLLDGTTRGFKSTGQNHEFTVMLTNGENRIKATAFNSQRTESIPDEIVVHYKVPEIVKTNMHILAVGINSYLNPKYNLNYAKNDADAFVKSLSKGASSLFGKVEVTTINDADATKTGILAAIEKIKSASKAEDVFVFYYAGHGVMSSGTGVEKPLFYLVPHDVTKMYEADEMLKKSGISATEIGEFSKTIKAQKQLFVIDACQSGGAMQTLAMRGAAEEKAIAQLARSTGTYFIAASGTEQFATEVAELGHGIFTYSVIEALKGSCKSQDGKVTVNLLKSCVEDLVPELSKKHKGQPQFPTGYGFGMDFPIVIVK